MINPERLNEIMAQTELASSKINNVLLRHIAERIVQMLQKGNEFFMPSTVTELRQLMAKGFSLAEIEKIMSDIMPSIQKDIKKAFLQAGKEIANQNIAFAREVAGEENAASFGIPYLQQVGITDEAEKLHLTEIEIRKLESAYRRTNGTIYNLTRTTASQCQKLFIDTCDYAYQRTQAGASPATAIVESIRHMCENGIEYVDYDSGRTDRAEVAIARAVRTGVNKANADIIMQRSAETGVGYVLTSQHMGARITKKDDFTNHSLWQGRVFSLDFNSDALKEFKPSLQDDTGEFIWMRKMREWMQAKNKKQDSRYPDFVKSCGYGEMLGICGINCRHTFSQFVPGVNTMPEQIDKGENAERFKLDQKQREMERAIRKTKREYEGIKATGIKEEIKLTKQKLYAQSDAYMDFCQKNGLKPRNYALQTTYTKATNTRIEGSENNTRLLQS